MAHILFNLLFALQHKEVARIFNNLPERQAKVNSLLAAQEKAEAAKVTKQWETRLSKCHTYGQYY